MRTTTIRVAVETRDRLNSLARKWGSPARDVVAELIRQADDDNALLEAASKGWSSLASDPVALAAYRGELLGLGPLDANHPL
jgi:hypothetical protein